jgi:hypothetical protein
MRARSQPWAVDGLLALGGGRALRARRRRRPDDDRRHGSAQRDQGNLVPRCMLSFAGANPASTRLQGRDRDRGHVPGRDRDLPAARSGDDRRSDPAVAVEVLSPSTETHDRIRKWREYQTIASLEHFVPGTHLCVKCAEEAERLPPQEPWPRPPPHLRRCPWPNCGKPTEIRENRTTGQRFVGCTGFPRCRWTTDLPG